MKRNLFIALAIVAITTVSCRKNLTCTCNTTKTEATTNGNTTTTEVETGTQKTTYTKARKRVLKMNDGCTDRTESHTTFSGNNNQIVHVTTTDYSCDLK